MPGRVPPSEVNDYYEIVDICVFPRQSMRLTELVTPLKPLEAMAKSRIVVASDVGGHRELIRDGETGFLFSAGNVKSLADRLSMVLASLENLDDVRAVAHRFVRAERNWEKSVANYSRVYGPLIGDNRHHHS
jgi:glycosyltransferase involved in cell wall biosynthesis